MNPKDAALVIVGHGSTVNAESAAPTIFHADEIRRRGLFSEVHACFWKEEPNLHQVWNQVESRNAYVVPNFISAGYFTQEIIPRELGLTGPLTQSTHRSIAYCEPVGLHEAMGEALLKRAREVVEHSGEKIEHPEKDTCLFICGHGTSLNENSAQIIHRQVAQITALGLYAECHACFMAEKPFVKDWRKTTVMPNVIVVPFFISDGLHSFEDIPVLLGMSRHKTAQASRNHFFREGNRCLWYASAVGTDPSIADIILSQVEKFDELHGPLS